MPYRHDARTDEARRARARELARTVEQAADRARAAARALSAIERRFGQELRALDAAIADAEDARRRVVHRSLALGASEDTTVRDRLRTGGAVHALERAMATRRRAPKAADASLDALGVELRALRARRAKRHAEAAEAMAGPRARLAAAMSAHDEALAELEDLDRE